jgi:hypothetical protein
VAAAVGPALGRVEVALVGLVALAAVVAGRSYALWREQFVVLCPAWTIFGIPCPTCGATRAVVAVMSGDIGAGFGWNPLAALAALLAVVAVPATLLVLSGALQPPRMPTQWPPVTRAALVAALALNWVYLLATFAG